MPATTSIWWWLLHALGGALGFFCAVVSIDKIFPHASRFALWQNALCVSAAVAAACFAAHLAHAEPWWLLCGAGGSFFSILVCFSREPKRKGSHAITGLTALISAPFAALASAACARLLAHDRSGLQFTMCAGFNVAQCALLNYAWRRQRWAAAAAHAGDDALAAAAAEGRGAGQ